MRQSIKHIYKLAVCLRFEMILYLLSWQRSAKIPRVVSVTFSPEKTTAGVEQEQNVLAVTEDILYFGTGNQYGYIRFYDLRNIPPDPADPTQYSNDPGAPHIIGREKLAYAYSGIPGRLALLGDYAYVSTINVGLQIVDIKKAKQMTEEGKPANGSTIVGVFETVDLPCTDPIDPTVQFCGHPMDIAVYRNSAFPVGLLATRSGHLVVLDLSKPLDPDIPPIPQLIEAFKPAGYSAWRVAVTPEYGYTDENDNPQVIDLAVTTSPSVVSGNTLGKINTLDLTDPYQPQLIGTAKDANGNIVLVNATDISINKLTAKVYITAGSAVYVIDIQDPKNPLLLAVVTQTPIEPGSTTTTPLGYSQALVEKDGWVYLANQNQGMKALDLGEGEFSLPFCPNNNCYPTGSYAFSDTDLMVTSHSIPMTFARSYRSNRAVRMNDRYVFRPPTDGPLGHGWTTPWTVKIEADAYVAADGRHNYFDKDANGNYLPDKKHGLTLTKTASGYELKETGAQTMLYDDKGKLTAVKDTRGNRANLTYDPAGKLTAIADVTGRTVYTFAYNADNRIAKVTDVAQRTEDYEYDATGNLTKVSSNGQTIAAYTYNDYHGLLSKTNGLSETDRIGYLHPEKGIMNRAANSLGNAATFGYDYQNRIFRSMDAAGAGRKYTVNAEGKLLSDSDIIDGHETARVKIEYTGNTRKITDAEGNVTTETVDEAENVTKRTDPAGSTWNYTYNADNKLLTVTDPLGAVTRYEYDQYGNKTKEIIAAGSADESTTTYTYGSYNELISMTKDTATTTFTYDAAGNITRIKDPLGNTTTMTYDTAGNLLTRTLPLIGTTTYADYNIKGKPGKVTDPNGSVTLYTYDLTGRVKTITTQADGAKVSYTYVPNPPCMSGVCEGDNGPGKISTITLPEGNHINYNYDGAGNLTKISDSAQNSINYAYDKKGNKTSEEIKDSQGRLQKALAYQYDLLNRPTKTVNPDGAFTENGYDTRGNHISLKTPNSQLTTYESDSLNRLIKVIQPGGITTTYTYDHRNNLKSVADANGNTTTYEYDKQNRVTKTVSPDTGTTTYTYDLNGNLKTKTDATGITITYQYDALNRLTTIDFPADVDIIYTYDACANGKGRLCTMTDASGTTSYEYTVKGEMIKETKMIDGITYTSQYAYDKNGNIKTITYPSGKVITYNYANDRVASVIGSGAALATKINYKPFGGITSLTYGNAVAGSINYDQQYQIVSMSTGTVQNLSYTHDPNGNITGIGNNMDKTKDKAFTYDALDRLATANGQWGSLGWTYDGVGNRQSQTDSVGTNSYTYQNGTNRLIEISGAASSTFTFDQNGNTTAENSRQYIYNQNQRLIKALDDRAELGEYAYNGNGQRAKKTVNGQTTIFHYNMNGQLIAESTATGEITTEYVYLNSQPLAKIEGNNVYYYHNDHLGTPQKMTDGSGAVVWSAEYTSFGEATIDPSSTITNNLRFPGQYYDQETGLHYNYFRDYDPTIGRYVQADPDGIMQGMNHLYVYVGNNPNRRIDMFGLDDLDISGYGIDGANNQVGLINPFSWLYWNLQGPTVVTDMSSRTTTFYPGLFNSGSTYSIETRSDVDRRSAPGAQDPFTTSNVTPVDTINSPAYGPNGAYIDTGDPRGRDIHGGGSSLPDPYALRQGWRPTFGCTRGQNTDVQELNRRLREFIRRHPGVPIPYVRQR